MNINTKYPLSKLTFGCEPLGGTDWGKIDLSEIRKSIEFAVDNGINVFDVADVYGLGNAEIELTKALGSKIQDVFIITKFGVRWQNNENGDRARTFKDASPKYVIKALESSLTRLKLDTIPLYLLHWPDENTIFENTIEVLEKVKSEGKILNYGISNFFSPDDYKLLTDYGIAAYQGPFNLIDFDRSDHFFKHAKKADIYTFSYGALAQGLLTGKFKPVTKFENTDRRSRLSHFQLENWERNLGILNILEICSDKYQKSISQIALKWVSQNKNIDSIVVGVKNIEQIKSNIDALNFTIENSDIEIINSAVGYSTIC